MELYSHLVERDVLVLNADGGLNGEVAAQMEEQLGRLVEAGARKVLVDCTHLGHITSTGAAVLLRIHKRLAERGGDVRLAAAHSFMVRFLELVHGNKRFRIYPTLDDALRAFAADAAG